MKQPNYESERILARAFRKRPLTIQALQYTRESREAVIAWVGEACRHTAIDDDGAAYETQYLSILTLEGAHLANLGDWIVRGVKGEFYPVKPEIFAATYDPADSNPEGS